MAVVVRIFDELTEAIERGHRVGRRRIRSAGWSPGCEAYVAFGLAHPARYGVLFSERRGWRRQDYCTPVVDRPGRPAGARIRG